MFNQTKGSFPNRLDSILRARRSHDKLGKILIKSGTLSGEQVNQALDVQKSNGDSVLFGDILIKLGFASEMDIVKGVVSQYRIPYIPVNSYKINREIIHILPGQVARKNIAIPLDKIGNILTVAISNPLNDKALTEIESFYHCTVRIFISSSSEILNAIDRYYSGEEKSE